MTNPAVKPAVLVQHRMGHPEKVGEAIIWPTSKESSFATESVLTADGGTSAW